MKNYLTWGRNEFPHNPTQNALKRFEKMPWGDMKSKFSDAQNDWQGRMKKALHTHFDDLWKDGTK